MQVIKRNGQPQEYDSSKIFAAIIAAFNSVGEPITREEIDDIIASLTIYDNIPIEKIQDQIETLLIKGNYTGAAKAFIIYREAHKNERELVGMKQYIQDYMKSSNAATGSKFDANANVTTKNVGTLAAELSKGKMIQLNRSRMRDTNLRLWGKEVAKEYDRMLETHELYKNDETSPIYPYTYSAKEVVLVIYKTKKLLVPFDLLYDLCDELEYLVDGEKEVYQKYPIDLCVYNKNVTNGNIEDYVKVTVLTKKARHRDLYRVKTSFGEDIIVTDNHPLITNPDDIDSTIEAKDSIGQLQHKTNIVTPFQGISTLDLKDVVDASAITSFGKKYLMCNQKTINRHINLTRDFGYIVGFFIGDGNYVNGTNSLHFCQKDREVLDKINDYFFDTFGIAGIVNTQSDKISLNINCAPITYLLRHFFKVQDKAWNKTLPINIFDFTEDFALGIIEGLLDSDGTVSGNQLSLRLSSRSAILQTTYLLRHFGFSVGNIIQNLPISHTSCSYATRYTVFGVNFTLANTSVSLFNSIKAQRAEVCVNTPKYKKQGAVPITKVEKVEESSFLGLNTYIYDITTETRTFSLNNLLVHNCVAITMYPLLLDGLKNLGGISDPPKHLRSYCGIFVNMVFTIAAQFAGAVATPEFLLYFDYFCRKEWGDNYWENSKIPVENILLKDGDKTTSEEPSKKWGTRDIEAVIRDYFQNVVYYLNQPAAARGLQSVFWNISYFDKHYFEGIFADFVFPDGTKPSWESLDWLQRLFMKWFNEERTKKLLTFPVETMALLTDSEDIKDKEYADFTAEMQAEGHSFFVYTSDSADSLSSCCFTKDTKILWKSSVKGVKMTTLEELYNTKWEPDKKNLRVFHNGSWVAGNAVKLPNRKIYKVVTANHKEYYITDNHINVTYNGEKPTSELTTNDYLMFNTTPLQSIPERDEGLTYEQGFAVGAFLGDGSFGARFKENTIYDINYSQNSTKYQECVKNVNAANLQLGSSGQCIVTSSYNNVVPVRISSKKLVAFIQRWVNWEEGTLAHTKTLNLDCLMQSLSFRQGILDGWYHTDGGNSNRCYTTSSTLKDAMEVLITSLGMNSIIDYSDRTDEPVIIREEKFNRNYPLWCVRWYSPCNKRTMGEVYKWKNNSQYFKITSIEEVDYSDFVYCIEMKNQDDPYFTLPSGLITHNCRLRNEIQDNQFSYSLGAGGVATGSKSVMTLNLNRLTQDWYNGTRDTPLKEYLREKVQLVHKFQISYNELLKEFYAAGMLTVYSAGFIDLNKQYLTIGVNGLVEAAEFLGIEISDNPKYREFVEHTLGTLSEENKKARTKELMFNTEMVPKRSGHIKSSLIDLKLLYGTTRGKQGNRAA